MNLSHKYLIVLIIVMMSSGAALTDQSNGQRLWNSVANERSCTTCHGDNPAKTGKHVKTGKVIKPMALSVTGDRYQDRKKVEKWFLRNCKWTFGRQCSAGEKSDILSWLSDQ